MKIKYEIGMDTKYKGVAKSFYNNKLDNWLWDSCFIFC